MNWRQHLSSKPDICHGKVCITGTRIVASVIFDSIADGMTRAELLDAFPSLREEHIDAVMAYASDMVRANMKVMPEAC